MTPRLSARPDPVQRPAMRLFAYIFLIATLAGSGWAAWFIFGAPNHDSDPELTALKQQVATLEIAASSGNANAIVQLGWILLPADSKMSDPNRAVKLFRDAAAKGHVGAQYALGWAYANGRGVPSDFGTAANWYRIAATAGNDPRAQFALGELYFNGRGVANDYSRAIDYYGKAAVRGHPVAQYLLGIMYLEGWGVKRDPVEAYKWFLLAAPKALDIINHNPAFDPKGQRERLGVKLNRTQIARAEQMARKISDGRTSSANEALRPSR